MARSSRLSSRSISIENSFHFSANFALQPTWIVKNSVRCYCALLQQPLWLILPRGRLGKPFKLLLVFITEEKKTCSLMPVLVQSVSVKNGRHLLTKVFESCSLGICGAFQFSLGLSYSLSLSPTHTLSLPVSPSLSHFLVVGYFLVVFSSILNNVLKCFVFAAPNFVNRSNS